MLYDPLLNLISS